MAGTGSPSPPSRFNSLFPTSPHFKPPLVLFLFAVVGIHFVVQLLLQAQALQLTLAALHNFGEILEAPKLGIIAVNVRTTFGADDP